MPWLEKRGEKYRIKFRFGGKVLQVPLKSGKEADAQKCLLRFESTLADVHRGRLRIPDGADIGLFLLSDGSVENKPIQALLVPKVTVGVLFETYLKNLTPGSKEATTRKCEGIHMRHLARLFGSGTLLDSVTTGEMQRYVDRRVGEKYCGKSIKPQTVRKEIATLITVWNWAHRRDLAPAPCSKKGVIYPKGKEKPQFRTYEQAKAIIDRGGISANEVRELWASLFLSKAQVAEVLSHVRVHAAPEWLYPFFVAAAHTGARRSELLRSRVEDFDFANRMVMLREKKKSRLKETLRSVDMTPLVCSVVKEYFAKGHPGGSLTFSVEANKPISDGMIRDAFHTVMRNSPFKVLRGYHVLRHSFASNMTAAGIDEHVISALMGHLTIEMRDRYRHSFPSQRHAAVAAVYG